MHTNGLSPLAFPSLRRLEVEIVAIAGEEGVLFFFNFINNSFHSQQSFLMEMRASVDQFLQEEPNLSFWQ